MWVRVGILGRQEMQLLGLSEQAWGGGPVVGVGRASLMLDLKLCWASFSWSLGKGR